MLGRDLVFYRKWMWDVSLFFILTSLFLASRKQFQPAWRPISSQRIECVIHRGVSMPAHRNLLGSKFLLLPKTLFIGMQLKFHGPLSLQMFSLRRPSVVRLASITGLSPSHGRELLRKVAYYPIPWRAFFHLFPWACLLTSSPEERGSTPLLAGVSVPHLTSLLLFAWKRKKIVFPLSLFIFIIMEWNCLGW